MPALRSTALIRWSKILSWNILTSISCQEEAASQSQFRQCIVLAEVFPTCKPNFRIKIHKTLQPFACWAVRWLTISSQSSAIKFFRIFSVWEILSSASLKPWEQKQVTRVPCLGIQISTCSWILNWINELMKSHPLPPPTVHELRYPSAREIYTHTHPLMHPEICRGCQCHQQGQNSKSFSLRSANNSLKDTPLPVHVNTLIPQSKEMQE